MLCRCAFDGTAASGAKDGETSVLRFGGVYYTARVWLNGTYMEPTRGTSPRSSSIARKLRPVASGLKEPPVFVSRFVLTHVRVHLSGPALQV